VTEKVLKENTVSVNFSHGQSSLLLTHDDMVMHALVWLCRVQFSDTIWCFIC